MQTSAMTTTYSQSDFERIINQGICWQIPDEILHVIKDLETKCQARALKQARNYDTPHRRFVGGGGGGGGAQRGTDSRRGGGSVSTTAPAAAAVAAPWKPSVGGGSQAPADLAASSAVAAAW
jgi:hypothetical protein